MTASARALVPVADALWEPVRIDDLVVEPDQRGSARTPLFMLVRTADTKAAMWATDLGLGGMQCRSKALRFPGVYLDMEFRLPITGEAFRVGGQVQSLDQGADGNYVLGVRFVMVSPRMQLALYRFLDRRRALWGDAEPEAEALPWADPEDLVELPVDTRPLAQLLWRHFHDLRAEEIASGSLDAQGPSPELMVLCEQLGT